MNSTHLIEYCEFNVLSKEWYETLRNINEKLEAICSNDSGNEMNFAGIQRGIEYLMLLSEGIYENSVVDEWFKEFVEKQVVLLLWIEQEFDRIDRMYLLDKYKSKSDENHKNFIGKTKVGIEHKKKLLDKK